MTNLMRAVVLSFFLLVTLQVSAQTSAKATKQPITWLNHVALHVNDLQKTTAFYENFLQLKKIPEPFHDGLHTWFSVGEHAQLHLIQGKATETRYFKGEHLCFSVTDINAFVTKLNQAGIKYENWAGAPQELTLRTDGVKQLYFQDPDGHWIEVNNNKY